MTRDETLQILSDSLPLLREQLDVKELALFGSVARNENTPSSDIDVLVTFVHRPTFDHFIGLKLHLEELLAAKVDLGIRSDIRPELKKYIERDAINVP
jgi:predicted nucleotidyltransferase